MSSTEKNIDINSICCQICNFNAPINEPTMSNIVKKTNNENTQNIVNDF